MRNQVSEPSKQLYDEFGAQVAAFLRTMHPSVADYAQIKIMDLMYTLKYNVLSMGPSQVQPGMSQQPTGTSGLYFSNSQQ